MPEGLELMSIEEAVHNKTLAANTIAAEYTVEIPLQSDAKGTLSDDPHALWQGYMGQKEIIALKKQKKKKEPVPVDIRPKIREMVFYPSDTVLRIEMFLDSGSESNLSPELVIATLLERFDLAVPRSDIKVTRRKIHFKEILT